MKNLFSIVLVFSAFLLIVPAVALFKKPATTTTPISQNLETIDITEPTLYKYLDTTANTVKEITPRDYIIGAVFAQIPASFETETLKAQAVLAHTYIVRQHKKEQETPTENLLGSDFSTDTNVYQAFFTVEQAKALYSVDYDVNYAKISKAVDLVLSEIITFENQPILSTFHSMSSGMTESAKIAWGNEIPYLQSVSSTGEEKAKGFTDEKIFTADELSARLATSFSGIKLGEDKGIWISILDKSPSGTVTSVKVGDMTLKGSQLRDALMLRSSCFDVTFDGSSFKFSTKGVGHCVGLSQYGANSMALSGKNYQEIISYYFTGVSINKLK